MLLGTANCSKAARHRAHCSINCKAVFCRGAPSRQFLRTDEAVCRRQGRRPARLCEAVALEDGAAQHDLEELLHGGAERRAAADDEPQAAAEALLDGAEHDIVQQGRRLGHASACNWCDVRCGMAVVGVSSTPTCAEQTTYSSRYVMTAFAHTDDSSSA